MSDLDLDAMEAVAQAATPGPWRQIEGSPGYLISSEGEVWSEFSGRPLRPKPHPSGHLYVQLGRKVTAQVHRLVLMAFVGPPGEGQEGCHINGDPADNRVQNLRWGTRSENLRDAVRHGTHFNTKKTHCPKGHPYSPENTLLWNGGKKRICATCNRARQRIGGTR